MLRRTLLIGASAGAAALAAWQFIGRRNDVAVAAANDAGITDFDRILGNPDAPVTILEYASLTCPHCASFHKQTLPELRSRYIDTDRAKLVFRHFPLNQLDLKAGQLLRCAPASQYYNLAGAFFESQEQWIAAGDPVAALSRIARMAGLTQQAIDQCLADDALADQIIGVAQIGQQQYGVNSTPTFVVEGKVMPGGRSIDEFAKIIDSAG